MIDFTNKALFKLMKISNTEGEDVTREIRLLNEKCLATFNSMRDYVVFTDRRIIAINTQGVSGRKKDFTSMPYSKITVFSVETAGMADLDSELEVYFSGVGNIKFEFSSDTDIKSLCRIISAYVFGDEEEKRLILNGFATSNEQKVEVGPPDVEAGPNEWKCPNCGRVNQDYVGTCGCGRHK